MVLTLWLVRHGETDSNAEQTFQGHIDVALNQHGELQAREVAEYFDSVRFDAVYSSDLTRAARTAELIVGGAHCLEFDPDLREMHYGVLQGVRYTDAGAELTKHGLADLWHSGAFHRRGHTIPEGESVRRFRSRITRFVRRLDTDRLNDADHNVLVVAHGGTLGMMLTILLKMPSHARTAFRFSNCSISKVSRSAERSTLDLHNLVVWDAVTLTTSRAQFDRQPDPGGSHPLRS